KNRKINNIKKKIPKKNSQKKFSKKVFPLKKIMGIYCFFVLYIAILHNLQYNHWKTQTVPT
ncbi:MAG: hypothetical protein FWD19_04520, partial [Defluviitaleaceae bacterium]|nr:hypothetical protein [Defluviitaleaceae bacterium]